MKTLTIDEMIEALQEQRKRVGGHTKVYATVPYDDGFLWRRASIYSINHADGVCDINIEGSRDADKVERAMDAIKKECGEFYIRKVRETAQQQGYNPDRLSPEAVRVALWKLAEVEQNSDQMAMQLRVISRTL